MVVLVCSTWGGAAWADAATAEEQLERARELYAELEYPAALEEAVEVTARPDATEDERTRAHLLAGIVARIMERDVDARMHFLRVLEKNPYEKLPPGQPPKIVTFYDLIQKEVQRDVLERKKARFMAMEREAAAAEQERLEQERLALEQEKRRLAAEQQRLRRQKADIAHQLRQQRAAQVDQQLGEEPPPDPAAPTPDAVGGALGAPEEAAESGALLSLLGWGGVGWGAVLLVLGTAGSATGAYAYAVSLPQLGAMFLVAGLALGAVGLGLITTGVIAVVVAE